VNQGADSSPVVPAPATPGAILRWLGVSRPQLLRGALGGATLGVVAAAAWFAVVAGTTQKQAYLIPVVGAATAYGVHKGMKGHGRAHAVLSVTMTAIFVLITMYYVERLLVVRWFAANGDRLAIPLIPYLDWFWSVLRRAFTGTVSSALYAVFGVLAAGWLGHQGFEAPPARQHDA